MGIARVASAANDFGIGYTSGTNTTAMNVPNGAAIWVWVAEDLAVSNNIEYVTDNVGNIYNLYKVVVNTPNSAPGLWLYIADNVIGSSVLTVTLKNSSGTSTCVAVSVYTGTARTSFRSVGVGGANKPGHGTESDSATYQVLDLEVFGFAVQTNRAGVSYSSSGGSTVDNWTVGTAGNVAIGAFDQTFGTDGNQTIAGSQSSTYPDAFFAAVVAAAIPWTDLVGKPFVTVSPVGMSQTGFGMEGRTSAQIPLELLPRILRQAVSRRH